MIGLNSKQKHALELWERQHITELSGEIVSSNSFISNDTYSSSVISRHSLIHNETMLRTYNLTIDKDGVIDSKLASVTYNQIQSNKSIKHQ